MMNGHIERLREYLAIAQSGDAKREAYKRAAEEAAAYIEETKATQAETATLASVSQQTLAKLLKWRASGFEAATPFLMDEKATQRAAVSHAKAVLKDPEQTAEVLADLTPAQRDDVREAIWVQEKKEAMEPGEPRPKRPRPQVHDDAELARRNVDKALWALAARYEYFGSVPVSEEEQVDLGRIVMLAQKLLGQTELDAELSELLS